VQSPGEYLRSLGNDTLHEKSIPNLFSLEDLVVVDSVEAELHLMDPYLKGTEVRGGLPEPAPLAGLSSEPGGKFEQSGYLGLHGNR
jgi:hypothetical protein